MPNTKFVHGLGNVRIAETNDGWKTVGYFSKNADLGNPAVAPAFTSVDVALYEYRFVETQLKDYPGPTLILERRKKWDFLEELTDNQNQK